MKNYSYSRPRLSPLPRLKDLPPSNSFLYLICALLLLVFGFSGTAQAQTANMYLIDAAFTVPAKESERASSLEFRVFELVNAERIKNGRDALVWVEQAAAVARFHSVDMAQFDYLSHADTLGRNVDKRADKLGLNDWRLIGENIAWLSGYADPAARVVQSWMNSPGHRQNILQSKFREGGIGMALTPAGKYYFTQVFVSRK